MKSILIIMSTILFSSFTFSQGKEIMGKITDETGEPLFGVSIVEQGTKNGTTSDINGKYVIKLKKANSRLDFYYLGYKTIEQSTNGKSVINIKMEPDNNALDEITITSGIRASQLKSVKVKREASTVIEAITPEDIGSFSDINVADALERVPGVQIERDVDGVSGDRVSIRGIGPQFVKVTMNGRTPISAGNEGRSDMRKFNLNMIPTEVISGARIHKTTQAKEISTDIGGTVDFQTIRPLDQKYKRGKNYFASIDTRGTSNTEIDDINFNQRFSGVFGGKITEKFGVAFSMISANEKFQIDEATMRGYRIVDLREDTNNDGAFDVNNGDTLYEDILVGATNNNTQIRDTRKRLGLATALQYKPNDKLEFLLDLNVIQLETDSNRQMLQSSLAAGGNNNGLFGSRNFFSPGSFELNGNNLVFVDAAGADRSRINIQNRNQFYDNYTTNNIIGLNTKYKVSNKFRLNFDLSYSNLDYFQNLENIGARLRGQDYDNSLFSIDLRNEKPLYSLPLEAFDPTQYALLNTTIRQIRTQGENYALRLDLEYDINEKTLLTIGSRLATTDFETREASIRNNDLYGAYTNEQQDNFRDNLLSFNNLTEGNFLEGGTGLNQWLNLPARDVLNMTPGFSELDGSVAFDFDTPLGIVFSEGDNLVLAPARSYSALERSFSSYSQIDTRANLFNIPVILNLGVRAIQTYNESAGFTGVEQIDPLTGDRSTVNGALFHEVKNTRWDVLPSLNANFLLKKDFNIRASVSRGASRPRYRDMIPNNDIRYLDPTSDIFNPASPDYEADLGNSLQRGTITSGNPDLKPYSAWMYDTTFELYDKNGGAFIVSAFYKDIRNYIGRTTLEDQPFPGIEEVGVALPAGQENLLFDISKPTNITDAELYGFEVGFNQHFTFLPGFANGFGLRANYSFVESNFDGAIGDATNGFPGTSKHNFNSVMYYEKYGFSLRFTTAYRSNYLSNLGGVGSTRADEAHYTNGNTIFNINMKYTFLKKLKLSVGVRNLTGEDNRRYIDDDTQNLTSYYARTPIWTAGIRYKF